MILTMIDGEPVVVCWQPRDFEVVLAAAANMGTLPVAVSSKRPGYYPGVQELREGCCRPVSAAIAPPGDPAWIPGYPSCTADRERLGFRPDLHNPAQLTCSCTPVDTMPPAWYRSVD